MFSLTIVLVLAQMQQSCVRFHEWQLSAQLQHFHATMTNKPCGSVQQRLQWGISNSLSGNVLHSVMLVSSRLFQNVVHQSNKKLCCHNRLHKHFSEPAFCKSCETPWWQQSASNTYALLLCTHSPVSNVPCEGSLCCVSTVQLPQTRKLLQEVPMQLHYAALGSKEADWTCSISKNS